MQSTQVKNSFFFHYTYLLSCYAVHTWLSPHLVRFSEVLSDRQSIINCSVGTQSPGTLFGVAVSWYFSFQFSMILIAGPNRLTKGIKIKLFLRYLKQPASRKLFRIECCMLFRTREQIDSLGWSYYIVLTALHKLIIISKS